MLPCTLLMPSVRRTDRKEGGVGDLAYPLVSDLKREISQKYGVLSEEGVALRGLFIIDKEARRSPHLAPCRPQSSVNCSRVAQKVH